MSREAVASTIPTRAPNPDRLELYHLEADIGESDDLAEKHPDVVKRLTQAMNKMRETIGDDRLGIEGRESRPPAITPNPKPV